MSILTRWRFWWNPRRVPLSDPPLPRLCMAGGRRQKPVAGGKAPCTDRADRASLSRCRCLCRMEQRADGMTFCKVMVSDLIEKNATPEQKAAHIDIADWIIYQIRDSRINCTADHPGGSGKNPAKDDRKEPRPSKLIDDLGLVLVECIPNRQR